MKVYIKLFYNCSKEDVNYLQSKCYEYIFIRKYFNICLFGQTSFKLNRFVKKKKKKKHIPIITTSMLTTNVRVLFEILSFIFIAFSLLILLKKEL